MDKMRELINVILAVIGVVGAVALVAWAAPSNAADKTVTHLLAVVFFAEAETRRPFIVSPMFSADECMKQAEKLNKTDEQMRRPDLRAMGAEYVCLKIQRVTV